MTNARPVKWCYLSFADSERPSGSQFLGGCYVQAASPLEAITVAWALGLNPGGEVLAFQLPLGGVEANVPEHLRHRLLTPEELLAHENEPAQGEPVPDRDT